MINDLIKLSSHLDRVGLHKEADYLDGVIRKEAGAWEDFLAGQKRFYSNMANWFKPGFHTAEARLEREKEKTLRRRRDFDEAELRRQKEAVADYIRQTLSQKINSIALSDLNLLKIVLDDAVEANLEQTGAAAGATAAEVAGAALRAMPGAGAAGAAGATAASALADEQQENISPEEIEQLHRELSQ